MEPLAVQTADVTLAPKRPWLLWLAAPVILPFILIVVVLLGVYAVLALPFLSTLQRHPQAARPKDDPESFVNSTCGRVWLFTKRWSLPAATPLRGIVVLAHGLGEYCTRPGYEDLAKRLNDAGYELVALDHQGEAIGIFLSECR